MGSRRSRRVSVLCRQRFAWSISLGYILGTDLMLLRHKCTTIFRTIRRRARQAGWWCISGSSATLAPRVRYASLFTSNLLEVMHIVHDETKNSYLIVAGQGENVSKYTSYICGAAYIKLRNRFISEAESSDLFATADLLVLPYVDGSQSGPLMTALAFGLPVIATDVGELSSVVRSTGMGLVVPPRDKAALANSIIKIASDNRLRSVSKNAKRAFHEEFPREKISERVMRLYEKLLMR